MPGIQRGYAACRRTFSNLIACTLSCRSHPISDGVSIRGAFEIAGFRLRVPNIMKHVCVAARIGEGKAPGEGNSHSIAKTSNAASRGGRSRFQAHFAWMRPRSATGSAPNPRDSHAPPRSHPRKRGPYSTLRCAADSGCNPSGWHEFWLSPLSQATCLE